MSSTTPSARPRTKFATKYGPWAVITGASSGIGAEFARQLSASGLSVVLIARREARLHALAASIRATCGVEAVVVAADLCIASGVAVAIQACVGRDVGLLVNNAGIELHGSFFHQNAAEHRRCLALNVCAVTELAHAFGRRFCERGRGGIIFVSSIASRGMPWFATYSSSKAYVTTLALTLGEEMGRKGVDVMSLEPGLVESEMTLPNGGVEAHRYGSMLVSTEVCVREALAAFGTKAVFTPGFKYRVIKAVLSLLPNSFALWIISEYYKSVLDPKVLEYCQEDEGAK